MYDNYDPSYEKQITFIVNQMSGEPSSESVTIKVLQRWGCNPARGLQQSQRAGYDVSADMSWNCGLLNTNYTPDNSKSHQDVITLTGTTVTGQVVASSSTTMSVTGTQNASNPSNYSGDLTSGL